MHRPRAEVVAAGLGRLEEKVTRFDPHLVICSRPNTVDLGGRPAWIELPRTPTSWPRSVSTASIRRRPTPPWTICFRSWMRPRGWPKRSAS